MTTNIPRVMMDSGEMMLGRGPTDVAKARDRAVRPWRSLALPLAAA
jgi:hypothetical protein